MLKNFLLMMIFSGVVMLGGCALIDKALPPKYDSEGQPIPGSRQPTEFTQAMADTIPYGNVDLNVVLLALAGYEKFRAYRMEKGLKATLLAGKQVANDPELKDMWEKIKETYRVSHESAGVTSLIKYLLSKLPTITSKV